MNEEKAKKIASGLQLLGLPAYINQFGIAWVVIVDDRVIPKVVCISCGSEVSE